MIEKLDANKHSIDCWFLKFNRDLCLRNKVHMKEYTRIFNEERSKRTSRADEIRDAVRASSVNSQSVFADATSGRQ